MLRRFKPSPTLGVALLALFVALGGTGYAATKINGKDIKDRSVAGKKLKNGAVATKQLKIGAVATKQLRRGAVTGAKVRRGSLTARQVKLESLTGAQIAEQTLGTVPRAAVADAVAPEGAKSFVPAGRFHFGELIRMAKTGAEGDTPLRTLVASGPFTVEVGCYIDAAQTGAKVHLTSTEAGSVLDYEQGTSSTWTWTSNTFSAGTDFLTLIAPSGATVSVILDVVLNGLGTDCAYVAQYTTNR